MGFISAILEVLKFLGFISREVHDSEERKAGSNANQVEAMTQDEKRIVDAANAGAIAERLPDPTDKFNRDGK